MLGHANLTGICKIGDTYSVLNVPLHLVDSLSSQYK